MELKDQITVISKHEELIDIFENGKSFLKSIRTKRNFGGENTSEQLLFENVQIKIPILIGQSNGLNGTAISTIRPHSDPRLYHYLTHLHFRNGTFEGLHFNCYRLNPNGPKQTLHIQELTIEISGGEFYGPVRFSNSRIGRVKISGGTFHSPVSFERGVYDYIEISGGDFRNGLSFGTIVDSPTESSGFRPPPEGTPKWTSTNNGIYKSLKILGGKINEEIIIESCFFEDELLIDAKDLDILVNSATSKKSLTIVAASCSIVGGQFQDVVFAGKRTTSKITVDMVDSNSNSVSFLGYSGKDSQISIRNHACNICKFENFLNYGGIAFNNFRLVDDQTVYENINPSKEAQSFNVKAFYRALFAANVSGRPEIIQEIYKSFGEAIKESSKVEIETSVSSLVFSCSDLGKTSFIESSIEGARIHFKSSKFIDIFLAGTKFPKFPKDANEIEGGFNKPEQKRLALSQIRKIYENRGDQIAAGEYFAAELEVRREEARSKSNRKMFNERLPLFLSSLSNDHGQDWIYASILLLGIAFVLWLGLCISIFNTRLDSNSLIIFFDSTPYFLQFLLPIHRYDLIDDFIKNVAGLEKVGFKNNLIFSTANFFDAIWRILSGYLVYQLVAAFRKHGKK